jgi:hypothetical protein
MIPAFAACGGAPAAAAPQIPVAASADAALRVELRQDLDWCLGFQGSEP